VTTSSTTVPGGDQDVKSPPLVIDTDIHEYILSFDEDILPRLEPQYQRFARDYNWAGKGESIVDAMPYPYPNSGVRDEWLADAGDSGFTLELLQRHVFEQEGVSIGLLNGFYHVSGMEGAYEFAHALGCAYNDYQIDAYLDKDDRLRGSVHVVAHMPVEAAKEIDRVAEHPQIVQVFLPTVTNRQYGDPYYHPIYEAAERNGLAITFHHGTHTRAAQFGFPRYWSEWHALAPVQAAQTQLASLLVNGVFDKYPDLGVILLETGVAWVPWFMWRMDDHYRLALNDIPWVKRKPSEHMQRSVRISTQPLSDVTPRQFEALVEMSDSQDIFVFSTDWPHFDADSPVALMHGLSEGLREKVLGTNALDVLPRLSDLRR
jgi:predicted TIM-barrel fold metal-dependent hydrolase